MAPMTRCRATGNLPNEMMATYYGAEEKGKKERSAFLNFANKCNEISVGSRFYVDKDTDFVMELWFSGSYDKSNFANCLKQFAADWRRIRSKYKEEFNSFLK